MNVLIVEDHRLVADALQLLLEDVPEIDSVTCCYSSTHALKLLDEHSEPFGLILADVFMPGIDGFGLLEAVQNRHRGTPIVLLSASEDAQYVVQASRRGAAGYIPKTLPSREMLAGLRQIMSGQRYFPTGVDLSGSTRGAPATQSAATAVTGSEARPRIGRKQQQVLELIAAGNSNKQISQIVGITEATVKYHTSQLFRLLSVRNRTSCVREARSRGLLQGYEYDTNEAERYRA